LEFNDYEMNRDHKMRCLFCKKDSSESKSVEHIIPESLGNTKALLRKGVVCDKCNNYFSREVERPFLEAPAVLALRFHQGIPSKRGRIPLIQGILKPDFPVTIYRNPKYGMDIVSLEPDGVREIIKKKSGTFLIPAKGEPPSELVISRFLAKTALEAMAGRLQDYQDGLAYLVDETQLDHIRRHAREGFPKYWAHHARRIYDQERHFLDEDNKEVQTVYEYNFLQTDLGEWYFVLAIFGLELVINLGGPEIEGYQMWLDSHDGISPLYSKKNSETNVV
jgi:hypothetical protein